MTARSRIAVGVLVVGLVLLVVGIVVGLVTAENFREFVQYGDHQEGSCVPLPGGTTGSGWVAVVSSAVGGVVALGALIADRRPVLVVGSFTLAGSCAIAVWLNWSLVHAVVVCAPFANR